MIVIGYIRVSTEEQAESGAGLEGQRLKIEEEVAKRGWQLERIIVEPALSAKDMRRPELQAALEMLDRGEATCLMVAKVDRLSRSMHDFTGMMAAARASGWTLLALDCPVDPTTPAGEMMLNMLGSFAQFERRLIGERTKDALAVKRAAGVRLGRPPVLPRDVRERIIIARAAKVPYAAIADELNTEEIPTAQGGLRWYPSTVRAAAMVMA